MRCTNVIEIPNIGAYSCWEIFGEIQLKGRAGTYAQDVADLLASFDKVIKTVFTPSGSFVTKHYMPA